MAVTIPLLSSQRFARMALGLTALLGSVVVADPARAAVDMNISVFTDLPDPVPAGGFITYDLRVENSGNDPTASNATLRIQLPASTTFQSVAPSAQCNYSLALHEVNCDFGILQGTLVDPLAFRDVQIVVKATAPGTVTANATVLPTDGNPANNALAVTTTVDNGADIRFQSFVSAPNPVTAGGIVSYSVIPENFGPNAAGALTVVFNVPPGLSFDGFTNANGWSSCSSVPAGAGSTVTCTNAAGIAAGSTAAPQTGPTLTWRAKATAASTGTLRVSGSISSTTGDGNLSNNQSTADVQIQTGTDMSIVKTVSADPVIGLSAMSFGLNVTNLGPFPASNVTVTDTVPVGFTGISAAGAGWTCAPVDPGIRLVSCSRSSMAVGSAPITISATAPDNALIPLGGQTVDNTALVSSDTADAIPGNNSSTVSFRVQRDGADLRPVLGSRGPNPVALNSDITTVLRVRNNGPRTANGALRINYQLAAGESLMSFSGTSWSCSPTGTAGALVTCDRTAIAGGIGVGNSSNPLTLVTQTTTAGGVAMSVCTSSTATPPLPPTEGDIDNTNDCISDGSVTASSTTADLRLSKAVVTTPASATVPPTLIAQATGTLTYTLVVTNDGPDPATNVVLTDPIPMYAPASGARPATGVAASVTAGATGGEACSGTSTVTCTLGTIANGSSKTVTVTVDRPMRDGTWRNSASVFSQTIGDSNRANNTAFADVVVEAVADVALTSKVVTPDPVKSGVEATYTIQLRNNGPSSAQNVTVTDTFGATGANGTWTLISVAGSNGATCPTAPQTGISAAFPVVCNFGTVPPDGVRSMTVIIRPDHMPAPPPTRQFANTAAVSTTTTESDATNNSRAATLNVVADEIDLLITETDLADPVGFNPTTPASNIIVYRVDVTNRGPSYATGVRFTDVTTPPSGKALTFLCDRASAPATPHNETTACAAPVNICAGAFPTITCTLGDMAANSTQTRYLVYRVDNAPATTGDTYNKSATVTANEVETLLANNSDPEQTTVRMLADMELVSKTASLPSVSINQPFNWTIVARNNGPGNAIAVNVTDTLPAGMELTGVPTFAVSGGGASGNCTGSAGQTSFACAAGDLTPSLTVTVSAPVRMRTYPTGGTVTNTARTTTDSIDPGPGVNQRDGTATVTRSSVSCTVYHDQNNDGVRQPSEPGIANVPVTLSGTDAYGNAVGPITVNTNGSGTCLFDNLPPSNPAGYTLTQPSQPAGYVDGRDNSTGTAGGVIAGSNTSDTIPGIVVAANTQIPATQLTFGEVQTASIAGRVWHDVNNNGLIDGGEATFIDGVTITLTGTNDLSQAVSQTTVTSAGGAYSFTGLRPGTYRLTETQPASPWLEGQARAGTGIAGPATGTADNALASVTFGNIIDNIQVLSGNTGVDYNFGELRPASVAGIVWYDIDNNGVRNGVEPPLSGVTVTLTGTDYRNNAVTAIALQTDTNGAYSFTNLRPGTYVVTETQPVLYADGQTVLGTVDGTPRGTAGANVFNSVLLGSASVGINYNFGERGRGIAGTVYNDLNDDGVQNLPTELGIPGVTLRVQGCGVDRTTLTDGMGAYSFTGLPDCPAGYTLTETQPAGFSDGRDTIGTAGGTVANDQFTTIVLGPTTYATGYNFGEHGVVATDIGCSIVAPTVQPAGNKNVREPFNWRYTVSHVAAGAAPGTQFASTLPSGVVLTGTPTLSNGGTCTGAAAATTYSCAVGFVQPGQAVTVTVPVRVMSYPATGSVTAVAAVTTEGTDSVAANNACAASATIQQSTIAGTVFEDPNDNGVREPGERGIGAVSIRLTGTDLYGNAVDLTTTTSATAGASLGTYQFSGLAPADASGYTLTETQPNGLADGRDRVGSVGGVNTTNDVLSAIALPAATNATGYDFAELGQGLAGTVYVDSNNNGMRDPGEVGIPNVSVRVTGTSNTNSPVDVTVITDNNGNYLFGGLPMSNAAGYTIVESQPAAWSDGLDRVGSGGGTLGNDRITNVMLAPGVIATGYDFGERGGQLCGYVYHDRNNNGVRERGEAGIPGTIVTLTGTDINGNPISRTATTEAMAVAGAEFGRYCLTDLPVSDGTGYTVTETQPADTTDGRDAAGTIGGRRVGTAGNDVITGIVATTAGFDGQNYNFGERLTNAAAVSGYVWFDANHDRLRELTGRGGWTVELLAGFGASPASVIATATTDSTGFYRFDGLPAGPGYAIQFRSPQGNYVYGYIQNVTLTANTELTEQNQPIDPSGVVYDALTRQPVPGAMVRLTGPAGFDASAHLVGGAGNVTQTTDSTGEYKYLLLPTAPAGVYRLDVTVPTGYIQRVSTAIPACTNTLTVGPTPAPALAQTSDRAPTLAIAQHNPSTCPATSASVGTGANTTQYWLSLALSATSAHLLNNHIPIERVPTTDAIVVTKTTPKQDVSRGELVPYTITIRNALDMRLTDVAIQDQIPPGFQYRVGSATIDNARREPTINGRQLAWAPVTLERGQTVTLRVILVVGTGVGTGEFINQAWTTNLVTGGVTSNVARAVVRIVPDATFDCAEVIGKVFDDKNRNGTQDEGEPGIANVRLATVRGQLITTDSHGRFHVACADIPDEDRGSNFVIKLDERTLPTGFRLTTENPGMVRLTRGKMSKINFGASIQRVVRLDLKDQAFEPNSTALRVAYQANLDQLLPLLQKEQSVLRIAYGRQAQEDPRTAQDRVRQITTIIRAAWRQGGGGYALSIETEVYQTGGGK